MADAAVEVSWYGDDAYSGWDGERVVSIEPGESAEVSADKAEQLLADFPEFAALKGDEPKGARTLDDFAVPELDELAAELEVADYPSRGKAKKVAAIKAAQEAAAAAAEADEPSGPADDGGEHEMPDPAE